MLEKQVLFRYYDSRAGACVPKLLGDFQGTLQTDGYKAYEQLGSKENITHVACLAHVRRYFEKALSTDKALATHSMRVIQELYAIERELKTATYEERKAVREEKSKGVLDKWHQWLKDTQLKIAPHVRKEDKLLVAINYTLARWDKVMNYLREGCTLIDNNSV